MLSYAGAASLCLSFPACRVAIKLGARVSSGRWEESLEPTKLFQGTEEHPSAEHRCGWNKLETQGRQI